MKIDLHVHTFFSDGSQSPKQAIQAARRKGMDGLAFCDHNTQKGYLAASKISAKGLIILPGLEVSTDKGHLVGLGLVAKIKKGMSPEETADVIRDNGGLVIAPHPGKIPSGIPLKVLKRMDLNAVEALNGRAPGWVNENGLALAKELKAAKVGGSDGHTQSQVGSAYTVLLDDLTGPDDVYESIRKRRTKAEGRGASLPGYLWDNTEIFGRFTRRGFNRV